MALNRLHRPRIDARNPRTRVRELPRGRDERRARRGASPLAGIARLRRRGGRARARCASLLSPIPLAVFALYPLAQALHAALPLRRRRGARARRRSAAGSPRVRCPTSQRGAAASLAPLARVHAPLGRRLRHHLRDARRGVRPRARRALAAGRARPRRARSRVSRSSTRPAFAALAALRARRAGSAPAVAAGCSPRRRRASRSSSRRARATSTSRSSSINVVARLRRARGRAGGQGCPASATAGRDRARPVPSHAARWPLRVLIGMTGASGAVYGVDFLRALPRREVPGRLGLGAPGAAHRDRADAETDLDAAREEASSPTTTSRRRSPRARIRHDAFVVISVPALSTLGEDRRGHRRHADHARGAGRAQGAHAAGRSRCARRRCRRSRSRALHALSRDGVDRHADLSPPLVRRTRRRLDELVARLHGQAAARCSAWTSPRGWREEELESDAPRVASSA